MQCQSRIRIRRHLARGLAYLLKHVIHSVDKSKPGAGVLRGEQFRIHHSDLNVGRTLHDQDGNAEPSDLLRAINVYPGDEVGLYAPPKQCAERGRRIGDGATAGSSRKIRVTSALRCGALTFTERSRSLFSSMSLPRAARRSSCAIAHFFLRRAATHGSCSNSALYRALYPQRATGRRVMTGSR